MAVPTEGTANLSMRGIKDELENNNYAGSAVFSNISLKNMSDGTDVTINSNGLKDSDVLKTVNFMIDQDPGIGG